jgi:transcriptional regulator GlxA family with amidase domain
MKTKTVTILALDKTMASTVTGPMDIFSLAGVLWHQIRGEKPHPYFDVKIASVDGKKVACLNHALIQPNCAINEIKNTDLIIISAAHLPINEKHSKKIIPWLIHHYNRGTSLVCVYGSFCFGTDWIAQWQDGNHALGFRGFV